MNGAGRADLHQLHVPGTTAVHRLAPEAKVLGLAVFAATVALTPRTHLATFAVAAVGLAAVVVCARLPLKLLLVRLTVVVPFVAFAAFLPFIGTGERADVAWFSVSVDGAWAAWGIVAKAGLGATASIVVAATTPVPHLLDGLTRLHVPRVLVSIISFMIRYLGLLAEQLGRMRTAMTARGHDPRWLWQVRPIASSVGVLFVRSYERGERVHRAMLARGYDGAMPRLDATRATAPDWARALCPAAAVGLALIAEVAIR